MVIVITFALTFTDITFREEIFVSTRFWPRVNKEEIINLSLPSS